MPSFTIQLWIILKIWFFALVFNTLIGTVYLVIALRQTIAIPELLIGGSLIGGLFSLPSLLVLCLVLNRCVARDASRKRTFNVLLVAAVLLSLVTSFIFIAMLGEAGKVTAWLPLIAVSSAVAGTATQYGQIRNCMPDLPELA
jgi:uncharacterized PurR-regulated membrane protein YhhQ (DUF165 family)